MRKIENDQNVIIQNVIITSKYRKHFNEIILGLFQKEKVL
jgi:hypothetical protein